MSMFFNDNDGNSINFAHVGEILYSAASFEITYILMSGRRITVTYADSDAYDAAMLAIQNAG